MAIVCLPVSGTAVELRTPNGADDVFLAEQTDRGPAVATAFLSRVATHTDGSPIDWKALSLTDIDAALLELRRMLIGDWVRTAVRCTALDCGALFDISFRISDYLRHHFSRKAKVEPAGEPGWYRLARTQTLFRLPTANDFIALANEPHLERALASRCIRPVPTGALRRRVETAMQTIAPSLYSELDCSCHECGTRVPAVFNPTSYVLDELARRAALVYGEVHLLASCYHWSERDILALPQVRRARYAERAYAERAR